MMFPSQPAVPDEYVTISNSQLLALMSDEDRAIAGSIYEAKQHLEPRQLVELAYMMGRVRARGHLPETRI